MSKYRKQHYLPAAYLRNFSIDGPASSRKSMIWRIDARTRRLIPVDSQGFADYYYSQTSAAQVEREFQGGEDFYASCYSDFWERDAPSSRENEFGLLVMMLDLHIRNVAYAKASRNNNADYLAMSATVKYRILWGKPAPPPDDRAVVEEATQNWRVCFLRCRAGHNFLTSDNPSLLARVGSGWGLANLVLMPVTPVTYAVGYNRQQLHVKAGTASERDEATLTHLQVRNCLQCIYTRENLVDEAWTGFKSLLAKRRPRRPVEGPGLWGAETFQIPRRNGLEFIDVAGLR